MDLDYQFPSDTPPPPDLNGKFVVVANQQSYKTNSVEQSHSHLLSINGSDSFVESDDEGGMLPHRQLQDNDNSTTSLPFMFPATIPTTNSSTPNLNSTSSHQAARRLLPVKPPSRTHFDPNNLSPLSAVDSSDYRSPSSDRFSSDYVYGSAWDEFAAGGAGTSSSQYVNNSSFFNMQHLRRASMQSDVSSYGGHSSAVSPFDSPLLEPRNVSLHDTPDQLFLPSSGTQDSNKFVETLATFANQLGLESKQSVPMLKENSIQSFISDFSQYDLNGGLNQGVSINIVPSSPTWRGQQPQLQPQPQPPPQLKRETSLQPSPLPQSFVYRPEEQVPYDLQLSAHDARQSSSPQMPTIIVDNAPDTGNHQAFDALPNMHRRQRALSESFTAHSKTFPYDTARHESNYVVGSDDYTQPDPLLLHHSQDSATPPSTLVENQSLSHSSDSGQDSYYPSMTNSGIHRTGLWPDHLDVSNSPAMLEREKHGNAKKGHQRSQSVGYSPSVPTQQQENPASPWNLASVTAANSAALKCGRSPSASPSFMGSSSGRHAGTSPSNFVCLYPNCNKRFTRAYNLRSHMRTHTKERPFHCSNCDQSFVRLHDMKRHETLHSGIKAFVCYGILKSGAPWGCGRRFARQDALSRHFLKSASGKQCVKPFLEEMGLSVETLESGSSTVNGNNDKKRGRGKTSTDESTVFDSKFWEQFGKQADRLYSSV